MKTPKPSVLVVDNQPRVALTTAFSLNRRGKLKALAETIPEKVLGRVRTGQIDLVLLDLHMPFLDGSAVAAQLRTHRETKDIPIIFFTGVVISPREIVRNKNDYIIGKAIKPEDLERRILDFLAQTRAAA